MLRRWDGRRLLSKCVMGSIALSLGIALAGCDNQTKTVKVPISSWPGYEYFYLAHHFNLDQAQGVTIDPVQFPDPQAIVHAYLRGDLDVAQLTTVEAVDICARAPKRCPVVVLILNESRGGDRIAAAKSIRSMSELRGRRVAVTYSTLGPYVLSRALEQSNMRLEDVTLINTPMTQMAADLRQGVVDAAVFYPPFSDFAARDGHSHVVFDSRAIPEEVFDVLVVAPEYLKENGETLTKIVKTWASAHAYATKHPKESLKLMAQREKVSTEEFQQSQTGLIYFSLNQQTNMLAAGQTLSRNLDAVKLVQQRLDLFPPGTPLPRVSNQWVSQAR